MNSQKIIFLAARQNASFRRVALGPPLSSSCFCTQKAPPAEKVAPTLVDRSKSTVAPSSTNLTFLSVLKGLKDSPSPALLYGVSGLIPFVAVPAYTLASGCYCPMLGTIQLWYGASILSFLGGVRWGHALRPGGELTMQNLGVSVTPSLAAVAALAAPYPAGVLATATALSAVAYVDLAKDCPYPHWFKSMRVLLSSVAVTSLLATFVLSYTHKKQKEQSKPTGQ
ncbi:transmembrane protein 69-like [Neocloeon triangulifer]|uniref:transmembrane protein 69-like n=1 Tax=Neocloeon triangulifer TaxID=2078957 RepID=UPI00286F3F87|nr:transmembrane protein 69-like [Neocloeon triangulifer]